MGIFQQFPYSNFHEFNLDEIIKIMRQMQDEWANTKSEWASYKDFIDNYFENLDVSQEVLDAMRIFAADGTLNAILDDPIAAATVEWLTEHITQPTTPVVDTSLSIAGAAADALATGTKLKYTLHGIGQFATVTELPDADAVTENTILTFVPTSTNLPANLPAGIKFGEYYTLISFMSGSVMSGGSIQILINDLHQIWQRHKLNGSTWDSWYELDTNNYKIYDTIINNNNYASLLPDINNINENCVYTIVPVAGAMPANLPVDVRVNSYYTLRSTKSDNAILQELTNDAGHVNYRYRYNATTWGAWENVNDISNVIISPSNYSTLMPDLDTFAKSGQWLIVPSSSGRPAHMPAAIRNDYYALFRCVTTNFGGNGTVQEIISETGEVFRRYKAGGAFEAWTRNASQSLYIVRTDGTGDFTSVLEAITTAVLFPGSIVYVDTGDYDIIQEYKDKYGATYFDDYSGSVDPQYQGINLYNGITLIMASDAKLTCKYTGNNALVRRSFSCLNAFYGDATLINVTIDAANIRYAIHDDPIIHKEYTWRHEYKHCKLKIDYTNEIPGINIHAVIGGGFGQHCDIVIEDCIFEEIGYGTDTTGVVGYHNCELNNSKSSLVIKNCYFKNGTAYATWYGASNLLSPVIITGNRVKSAPYTRAENAADYDINNIEFLTWNNTIE